MSTNRIAPPPRLLSRVSTRECHHSHLPTPQVPGQGRRARTTAGFGPPLPHIYMCMGEGTPSSLPFCCLSQGLSSPDYPNIEIVIVDDSETLVMDNPEMKSILIARNVRYIYLTERLSIGAKRNVAVENARGAIVVHWDDDDFFREHRISTQVAPILRGEANMTVLEHYYYFFLSNQAFYVVERPASWGPHFGTLIYAKVLLPQCGGRPPSFPLSHTLS